LIPQPVNGDQLVLFSSPLVEGGEAMPAAPVATIPFIEGPR
jgi:hypothetical protein